MNHLWLIITLSWVSTARAQFVNSGGFSSDVPPDTETAVQPIQYAYYNFPLQKISPGPPEQFYGTHMSYPRFNIDLENFRKSRTEENNKQNNPDENRWQQNLIETDKVPDYRKEGASAPLIFQGYTGLYENNATDDIYQDMEKRTFSPWGGKRDKQMKPTPREPLMPKRVSFYPWGGKRSSFNPWGGKRSGQMIYKPGASKSSKLIFASTMPELTRIISNYLPDGTKLDLAGLRVIPTMDKKLKILALSGLHEGPIRDALPFKGFLDALPKFFKPGHTYSNIEVKREGKKDRKHLSFSVWGGKRSPPIIGPIWTPAPKDVQREMLNAILLLRNHEDKVTPAVEQVTKAA